MMIQTSSNKLCLIVLMVTWAWLPRRVHCQEPSNVHTGVPAWAQRAIWYQVFVERFRNGDPRNDPRAKDIEGAWPRIQPAGWQPTPWGQDWYQLEPWARPTNEFYKTVYLRRYGGDLRGLFDKLDYLEQLGVTAIYLNPINDAPSLHKYDARNYRHVDRNFGPEPDVDERMMTQEDPADPSTWRWTSADRLFLDLVGEVHRRRMKIIVDYSWNHTGTEFWAWQDVMRRQSQSAFRDWYQIVSFDDPATSQNEFAYHGWHGVADLPQFKRLGRADGRIDLHPDVKRHIHAVTRRWLDPNGDGDPEDGVDGLRLDVAAELPLAFWRDYRRLVKQVNPDALLLGEVWWEKWPVRLADPAPWLQGDTFDSVMDYRWYVAARGLFAGGLPAETAVSFSAQIAAQRKGIPAAAERALMRMISGHDSPRCLTSLFNPGLYKYRASPRSDRQYRIQRPDQTARKRLRMILLSQFTSVAAPQIYYGDEVGMWGADDPDNRKPMLWADLSHDNEQADPLGRPRSRDAIKPDLELWEEYRRLIRMRREHEELFVWGDAQTIEANDQHHWLVVSRGNDSKRAFIIFNLSDVPRVYRLQAVRKAVDLLSSESLKAAADANHLDVVVDGNSGRILIRDAP